MSRNRIICFTGSHGSGKTVLATEVAKRCSLPFFPSHASRIHAELGFKANEDLSVRDRIAVQRVILAAWVNDFEAAHKFGGVFDRCPIDFAAYMADAIERDMPEAISTEIADYSKYCIELAAKLPHILFCVPVNRPAEDRGDGKADDRNIAYRDKIHHMIGGLLYCSSLSYRVIHDAPVEIRIDKVSSYMQDRFMEEALHRIGVVSEEEE